MATIKLNKKHYYNNLDIITTLTKTKDKIALVLKDNAYGHGLLEMAKLGSEYGITKAVVQTQLQAKTIESFFPYILVLAEIPNMPSDIIRYAINDINTIEKFPKNTKVELKIDTGMHRNGMMAEEMAEAYNRCKKRGLLVEAIFTHHRSADELSTEWFWQKENFKYAKAKAKELACKFGFNTPRFHSCNSAALLREKNFDEDMARVGIAAYGAIDMPELFGMWDFKPVLSLHAMKNSTRNLKAGERIGYGATYTLEKDAVVSNYDFGYGDGFFRALSNNYTTPSGVKLLGRISMDNSTFLSEADEIEIFNDARVIAQAAGTFSYEILTSLKEDIRREIVKS
ncbi:MAG: alanine racemase [Sulfurimonadaceae bacterium]|jgi:alanine racemase|nr:alanine racemase [Sulfurimonadaceae bacterium]